MKIAFVLPGQGSQYVGMAKQWYDDEPAAKALMEEANSVLGYRLTDIMFNGPEEELKRTENTQPAIFLHSMVLWQLRDKSFLPDVVAGHSLGEFSALVANGTLSFENGLKLVRERALAMQAACDAEPSTMAAVLRLEDDKVEEICGAINETVVPANYNCPGQLVISGSISGVNKAVEKAKEAGGKAIVLNVAGAFHSPFMKPAEDRLAKAINATTFNKPNFPIYQNSVALAVSNPIEIKHNLLTQLTAPVKWTQTIQQMLSDDVGDFYELGPGTILQGLIKKIGVIRKFYNFETQLKQFHN